MGLNSISTLKKAEIILICRTISDNSLKEAIKLSKKLKCEIFKTVNYDLDGFVNKTNIKIIAITDKNLAEAIIKNNQNELNAINQESING